ncbi:MAG: RlmE family RNA methyltransferase [Ardenticatenaceae bacterium]
MAKKHWRKKQGKDKYFQQAKSDGYRARSAYKLADINRKFRVIRKADQVLDVGAAPGSWSQLARKLVGHRGQVVAVDLQAIEPIEGVTIIQGDIREASVFEQIQAAVDGKLFNTVISDIAPNATGIRTLDHARSIELSLFALTIALKRVRKGGNFVAKLFMGEDFDDFLTLTKRYFRRTNVFYPEATRKESKETFIVGKGLRARADFDPEMGLELLLKIEPNEF